MGSLIIKGDEKSDNNFYSGAQLQVNGLATGYGILSDGVLSGRVQLGNAAAPLAGGERLQVQVIITNEETDDNGYMPPYIVDVPATPTAILVAFQPLFVLAGDTVFIMVHSNDSADNSVGSSVEMLLLDLG